MVDKYMYVLNMLSSENKSIIIIKVQNHGLIIKFVY